MNNTTAGRDPRRNITEAEKRQVVNSQSGLCYECGKELVDFDTHFHHLKPWADGGPSQVYNVVAVHSECHTFVHRLQIRNELGTSFEKAREWQQECLLRYADYSKRVFSIEACPGAGKTFASAMIIRWVLDNEIDGIGNVIVLAPWLPIIESMKETYASLQLEPKLGVQTNRHAGLYQRPPVQNVAIDTYAGFCRQNVIDVIKKWATRDEFRFLLILDEVHHTHTPNKRKQSKWGSFVNDAASLAARVIVMSGTYFRSDNYRIPFLEYENNKPVTDIRVTISQGIRHKYIRPLAFRVYDPKIEVWHPNKRVFMELKLSKLSRKGSTAARKAKLEALDPEKTYIRDMVREIHKDMLNVRKKYPDAACLFACSPSMNNSGNRDERHVQRVAAVIKEETGYDPPVVVHDDPDSRGVISEFRKGVAPYICAIRMISEGVDIPRLRAVALCMHTESETNFQQITGRCVRYIDGQEDGSAAMCYTFAFPSHIEFAERIEEEVERTLKEPEAVYTCPVCENDSCVCPCQYCGERPCQCEKDPRCSVCGIARSRCVCWEAVDGSLETEGGMISGAQVNDKHIWIAERIIDQSRAHAHQNKVQLGHALAIGETMDGFSNITVNEARDFTCRNIHALVKKLARLRHSGVISMAWKTEVHARFGVVAEEMKSMPQHELKKIADELREEVRREIENEG